MHIYATGLFWCHCVAFKVCSSVLFFRMMSAAPAFCLAGSQKGMRKDFLQGVWISCHFPVWNQDDPVDMTELERGIDGDTVPMICTKTRNFWDYIERTSLIFIFVALSQVR